MTKDHETHTPAYEVSPARVRAGRAIRNIGHAVVGHHASDELLDEVAATLESLTARLDLGEVRHRDADGFQRREEEQVPSEGDEFHTYPDRPYSGVSSPLGLDLRVVHGGDQVVAHFTLRAAHEGAPQRSHGGIVAAAFDDVFCFVLQLNRLMAFTGELTIRYEAGTPLGKPLQLRARLDRKEGRKLFIVGELWDGEQRVATGKSIFIERTIV
jgi:acyl-coenzyme A thioesterase PaaI-like protein